MVQRFASSVKKFIYAVLLASAVLCSSAPAVAQTNTAGTIRVQSREVLVPVVVLDKERVERLQHMSWSDFWHQFNTGNLNPLFESLAVPSLSATDFRLFQDGEEEKIESFKPDEQGDSPILTDNLGKYREFVGIGGGTWAMPLWEHYTAGGNVLEASLSGYEIGYTPSSSPGRACHKIEITVDRPNSIVFARREYCEASRKGADPLQGTALEKRIAFDLQKKRRGELSFQLAAIPLVASDGTARVRIVVDYASNAVIENCNSAPEDIGITGTVLGKDGKELFQFSDEAARTRGDGDPIIDVIARKVLWGFSKGRCPYIAPFRYETQVQIPSGKYRLKIGLTDGRKFGRAEVPFTVPNDDREQLSISGMALARRFRDLQTKPPESPVTVAPRSFHEIPMKPTASPIALPQNYAPLISDGVEITPTANTLFEKNDPFCYFFQIYEPLWLKQPQPKVEALLRIVDATTGSVVRQVKPIDAAPYAQPGNPLIPIGGRLDISNLPTGAYELQAKATDSTGASTQWRTVAFSVE